MTVIVPSKITALTGNSLDVRSAFAQFPSGVAALAVEVRGQKHALVASSFMVGVSLKPCLVAVAVQKTSETWQTVKQGHRFGVSIFGANQGELVRQLASKDRVRRFDGVDFSLHQSGAIFLDEAAVWFDCSLYEESDAGDHVMALLEVHGMGVTDVQPLIWHDAQFRTLGD